MKTSIAIIIGALASSACASSQTGRQPAAPESTATHAEAQPEPGMKHHGMAGGMKHHDMAAQCPMAVAGTSARAEDVDGGAAIAFTTTGDVAELRRRVAHMAEMHTRHHGAGHGPMGDSSKMGMMGDGMMMPSAHARSEDIDAGARIVLTPNAPADLAQLREHTRQHAEKMASGQCPMMSMHEGMGAKPGAPDEPHDHDHAGGH
jgi:hypothetical protein